MAIQEIKTFKDIQDAIIRRGKLGDNKTVRDDLKEKINTAEQQIIFEDKYRWASVTRNILLKGTYTTGTLSITQDTDDITGSGTSWDALSHFNWKMKLGSVANPYKILRVGSATSLTIDANYTGDTLSGESYTMYKDEYGLFPDFGEIRSLKIPGINFPLEAIGPEEMDEYRFRAPFRGGLPRKYTIEGNAVYNNKTWANFNINTDFWEDSYDTDRPRNARLILWPCIFDTDRVAQIRYTAIPRMMSNDSDEPTIPYKNRYILVLKVLMEYFIQGRDARTRSLWESEYKDLKKKMASDTDKVNDELIMKPYMKKYRRTSWAFRSNRTEDDE